MKTKLRHLKKYNYCIILPDDTFKIYWDVIIMALLIYTFICIPYRIAFVHDYDLAWLIIDGCVDFLFFVDIVVNFFTAFHDRGYHLVDNKWSICKHYLGTWFLVDFISIIPFNLIFKQGDYAGLVRLTKLSKLYRLVKMLR